MDAFGFTHHFGSEEEHVAFAEELFGANHIEHDAGVDLAADCEGDSPWNVGFNEAGDDLYFWALGG